MNNWFVRFSSGRGYIPARETSIDEYEIFGDYTKDRKECQQIVDGLNGGMWDNAAKQIKKNRLR